jgi:hypothetical protein
MDERSGFFRGRNGCERPQVSLRDTVLTVGWCPWTEVHGYHRAPLRGGMLGFNPSHPSQVQEGAGAETFRRF